MKKLMYLMFVLIAWSSGSRADHPAVHGMLVFGKGATYASHLSMFHSPHDYQLIFKLTFKDLAGGNVVAAYEAAKVNSPEYFTIAPEPMDLTQVMSGAKSSFKAALHKGHFERGGAKIGMVEVQVEKILLSTKLNGQTVPSENKFFVFGESGEYFAAHLIQGKPNFDAILAVKQPFEFQLGVCNRRVCPPPLQVPVPDAQLPLTLSGPADKPVPAANESLGEAFGTQADLQQLIYLEQDELAH